MPALARILVDKFALSWMSLQLRAMIATKSCNLFNEIGKHSLSPMPLNGKTIIF